MLGRQILYDKIRILSIERVMFMGNCFASSSATCHYRKWHVCRWTSGVAKGGGRGAMLPLRSVGSSGQWAPPANKNVPTPAPHGYVFHTLRCDPSRCVHVYAWTHRDGTWRDAWKTHPCGAGLRLTGNKKYSVVRRYPIIDRGPKDVTIPLTLMEPSLEFRQMGPSDLRPTVGLPRRRRLLSPQSDGGLHRITGALFTKTGSLPQTDRATQVDKGPSDWQRLLRPRGFSQADMYPP